MLTSCPDELPNPHKNCVREILNALICNQNDFRRITVELRNLQAEYKCKMQKVDFHCRHFKKTTCEDPENIINFTQQINSIDEMTCCFKSRFESYEKQRQELLETSKHCMKELNAEKCKLKQFHDKTVDYLKRYAIKSDDAAVIRNCEKDICEMQKLFVKEVTFIKKCENELMPFFQQLQDEDLKNFCNCCCFKDYEWLPMKKHLGIDEITNDIKDTMGITLKKAFAQLHIQQPADPKSFLAAYLMNVERNEEIMKEKFKLFVNI